MKKKAQIPGPTLKHDGWEKNGGYKFQKNRRNTVLGEIFERAKKKETSVPGPNEYNATSWKAQSKIGKTKGVSRVIAPKMSFAEE